MNAVELRRPAGKRPAPQAFYRWLRKQRDRRDPVGDLARDALGDRDFPKAADFDRAESYLYSCNACYEAHLALRRAFSEFRGCDRKCRAAAHQVEQVADAEEIAVEDLL